MASAPPPPPVTAVDLTQFTDAVDNARADNNTGLVATSNEEVPDLSMRGSLMVWGTEHLASACRASCPIWPSASGSGSA